MKGDTWAPLFAKARARRDRALLADCERRIVAEEEGEAAVAKALAYAEIDRLALALAFGRPISNAKGEAR